MLAKRELECHGSLLSFGPLVEVLGEDVSALSALSGLGFHFFGAIGTSLTGLRLALAEPTRFRAGKKLRRLYRLSLCAAP